MSSEKPHDLGVLFVHGIGQQPRGTTMVTWGETLIDWIEKVGASEHEDTKIVVQSASLGTTADQSAHADVEVKIGQKESRWLLTEAWWAESFSVPTFKDLVSWSVKVVPWAIAAHFARQMRRDWDEINSRWKQPDTALDRRGALSNIRATARFVNRTAVGFVVAGILSPLVLGVLASLLLVGMIPIERVRSLVGTIQRGLAGSIGDSLVLLENPIQAAAIRTRFRDRLLEMADTCEKLAVVAHSQGAAVAVDGLSPISSAQPDSQSFPPTALKSLVTFGAGVNKLQMLKKVLDEKREKDESELLANPWTINGCFIAMVILSWQIYRGLATDTLQPVDFWPIPFMLASAVVTILMGAAVSVLVAKIGRPATAELSGAIAMASLALITAGFIIFLQPRGLVIYGIFFLTAAVVVAIALGKRITELDEANVLNVSRDDFKWIDFYATADPVPNGPTNGVHASNEIHNVASNVSDHTTYWKNREQFVGPLASHLANEAGTPFQTFNATFATGSAINRQDIASKAFSFGAARRTSRVNWLRRSRWATVIVGSAVLLQPWYSLANLGYNALNQIRLVLARLPFGLDRWIPSPATQGGLNAVGISIVLLNTLVAYSFIVIAWKAWDNRDGLRFQIGQPASRLPALFWMMATIGLLSGVAWISFISPVTVGQGSSWLVSPASTWTLVLFGGLVLGWWFSARESTKTPGWEKSDRED